VSLLCCYWSREVARYGSLGEETMMRDYFMPGLRVATETSTLTCEPTPSPGP